MMINHREKRWLYASKDGRHVTAGRHTDPSGEEVQQAADALDKMGLPGWLCLSEGVYTAEVRCRF